MLLPLLSLDNLNGLVLRFQIRIQLVGQLISLELLSAQPMNTFFDVFILINVFVIFITNIGLLMF